MSRYDQLLEFIDEYQPKTIVETGVWNGHNAVRMIQQALKYHTSIEYVGYDLFEDATSETDAAEFNVKPHNTINDVYSTIWPAVGSFSSILLIKGDTKETLSNGMTRDFAFIDGGHSIETIASDYRKLKNCPIIVLDDYYTPDEEGNMPDINKYGCNKLVTSLTNYAILPSQDPVKGGGYTQFVLVKG